MRCCVNNIIKPFQVQSIRTHCTTFNLRMTLSCLPVVAVAMIIFNWINVFSALFCNRGCDRHLSAKDFANRVKLYATVTAIGLLTTGVAMCALGAFGISWAAGVGAICIIDAIIVALCNYTMQ